MLRTALAIIVLVAISALAEPPVAAKARVNSQGPLIWRDPSKHEVRFVTVQNGVQLEVLDWGGSGRPVVLLAGSGNTAHVFDDFAPKLIDCCHVYGITRRGFGASSQPAVGYDDQRLADDVFQVLESLRIHRPVLAGHSMAGGELTTLGNQHSDRLSGLVYLDALGDPRDWPASDPAYQVLLRNLPAGMREGPSPDYSSFRAHREQQARNGQGAFPESELRHLFVANRDGTMGRYKASRVDINNAIGAGQKKRDYSNIRVPVLAVFEFIRPADAPPLSGEHQPKNADERAALAAYRDATAAYVERWMNNLKNGVPAARFVNLPGAGHFVFLSRETEVLEAVRKFVATVPQVVPPGSKKEGSLGAHPSSFFLSQTITFTNPNIPSLTKCGCTPQITR